MQLLADALAQRLADEASSWELLSGATSSPKLGTGLANYGKLWKHKRENGDLLVHIIYIMGLWMGFPQAGKLLHSELEAMDIYSDCSSSKNKAMFHSYVKLPEGNDYNLH